MGKKEKQFAFPETIALLFFLICGSPFDGYFAGRGI